MSHCTKFDFTYSDEEAIVLAFRKLKVNTSTELVCEFNSDLAKKVLSKFGHLGKRQYRAICGNKNGINMFMLQLADNKYELVCEHPNITDAILKQMDVLAHEYKQAYIEVAVDKVVSKLENTGTPTSVDKTSNGYTISFGPNMEYKVAISMNKDVVTEEVFGVKGDFCTALTEDVENILSHPETELVTDYKEEINMMIEDVNLQVISLEF